MAEALFVRRCCEPLPLPPLYAPRPNEVRLLVLELMLDELLFELF